MDVSIARQPIFHANKRLYAYELLFREAMGAGLEDMSGDRATTSLLSSTFLTEGIEKIAGNRLSFINFTQDLLERNIAEFFPKTKMVVEILEDVEPTSEVLAACRRLVEKGYTIALDDFVYHKKFDPLIELSDIIKIDFRQSPMPEIERVLYRLSRYKLKFLAEKIETYGEFEQAGRLGFSYFQGYFFSRPEVLRIKDVASVKVNLLNLLIEVNRKTTTVERLEKIVVADVAITYKLLRYINSAYYYLLKEVKNVRQAIVYLGEQEIRRFVTLVLISELASDKPGELIRLSVVRAKFCELLAKESSLAVPPSELFLLGLFSLLNAILDTSMKDLMTRLPVGDEIKRALTAMEGPFAPFLEVVTHYEKGEREACLAALQRARVAPAGVYEMYKASVHFAEFLTRG